eukprot:3660861-Pyramimonas_sp.AAC.1
MIVRSTILVPSRRRQPHWASATSAGIGGPQAQPKRRRAHAACMELSFHCARAAQKRKGAGYIIADSTRAGTMAQMTGKAKPPVSPKKRTLSKRLCPLAKVAFNRGANDNSSSKRTPNIAF